MGFQATILTLFPEMFPGPLGHALAGKALETGAWTLETVQIRDFALDRHRSVDDTPAGGGAGMVLKPDVLARAIDHAAPADDPAAKRHRITGRVHPMISIPVVGKRLRRGDIVKKHHITWTSIRESSVRRDTILHEEDLVGMAAKRMVREHSPIRLSYVQRPVLVRKNGLVTIHLASKSMTLTAQGQAMQDGSRGEIVQVKNIQSKKVIEAVVTHAGKVSVSAPTYFNVN